MDHRTTRKEVLALHKTIKSKRNNNEQASGKRVDGDWNRANIIERAVQSVYDHHSRIGSLSSSTMPPPMAPAPFLKNSREGRAGTLDTSRTK